MTAPRPGPMIPGYPTHGGASSAQADPGDGDCRAVTIRLTGELRPGRGHGRRGAGPPGSAGSAPRPRPSSAAGTPARRSTSSAATAAPAGGRRAVRPRPERQSPPDRLPGSSEAAAPLAFRCQSGPCQAAPPRRALPRCPAEAGRRLRRGGSAAAPSSASSSTSSTSNRPKTPLFSGRQSPRPMRRPPSASHAVNPEPRPPGLPPSAPTSGLASELTSRRGCQVEDSRAGLIRFNGHGLPRGEGRGHNDPAGGSMTTRDWLRQNDYEDVAELIDEVMAARAARGSKERRNWWDVLAGGKDGRPNVVAGREFPVLRIAQARQGKPITPNAICRNNDERPPDMVRTGRWADPAT